MKDNNKTVTEDKYGFTSVVMEKVCSILDKALYKAPENDYAWEYIVLKDGYIEDSFLASSDKRAIDRFMAEYACA